MGEDRLLGLLLLHTLRPAIHRTRAVSDVQDGLTSWTPARGTHLVRCVPLAVFQSTGVERTGKARSVLHGALTDVGDSDVSFVRL